MARSTGTSTRRVADVRRLAEAIKSSGIDPRHWVSYGTVGSVDDDGVLDATDPLAIAIGPAGVEVDVVLEPLQLPVTCHYAGIQGGCSATILSPIKPGDQVIVVLPEGDPMGPPVIVSILHSQACKLPLGEDKKPIFQNDRLFIWAEVGPVDVRTKGGVKLTLTQDGKAQVEAALVELGGTGLEQFGPTSDGVVTGKGIDPFTGKTYAALGSASQVVLAKKLP